MNPTPGPWRSAFALLALRWRMVRSARVRFGLIIAGVVALGLMSLAAPLSRQLPANADAASALAVAALIFLAVAAIAPLAAGGGYQLFPPDQVVGQAIPARALVRISLLLTPLNLAWYAQTIGLSSLTLALRAPVGTTVALLVLMAAWVAVATVLGQTASWTIAGIRRTRLGRRTTWLLFSLGALVLYAGRRSELSFVLDRPAHLLSTMATHDASRTFPVTIGLLLLVLAGLGLTDRACTWTVYRRTNGQPTSDTDRPFPRRKLPATPYQARLRADRRSVWRSPPLRRGLLVLALLPAVSAGLARLDWPSLALLPAFVGSGSALLFGVNAFCLEGTGAIWLSTLPQDHRLALLSKAQVIFETTGIAVVVGMSGGLLRARYAPDGIAVAAVIASAFVATSLVVASCLRVSLRHPHRADLLGPRDTPAPPGAMAIYAARLTMMAGVPAALFSVFARLELGWPILATSIVLLAWAVGSILGTVRRWRDPRVRARVAATVATG
jgi:hypothetical protein